jgi:CheY-like chemotaxis protein
MPAARKSVQIILAEDDEDDYVLTKSAFEKAGMRNELIRVKNGEELLDLLKRRGAYAGAPVGDGARLVILDLNMPRMDGREALERIKADPELRRIPIIVMTTSNAEEDIARSYEQGACSFIHKPVTFAEFVMAAGLLKRYWLEMVELPDAGGVLWTRA